MYRPSTTTFYLWDKWSGLSIASPDYTLALGSVGDKPISGDWDGDGKDGIGFFRPSTRTFYLKNHLISSFADYSVARDELFHGGFELGTADIAIAGDWNQDGVGSTGFFRAEEGRFHVANGNLTGVAPSDGSYPLGTYTDLPFTGDWTHSGYSGLGVFRPSTGTFYLKYNLDNSAADATVVFGTAGDIPIAGTWGSALE